MKYTINVGTVGHIDYGLTFLTKSLRLCCMFSKDLEYFLDAGVLNRESLIKLLGGNYD